ncbi:glutathione S-transferase family protein [Pseudoalteromonas sp. MMG012]|uniref:glutathione S-transferase family protein n=1 Tax=Pseudoalteromonas sp. MMG012 TaxID=2822686 RepID=UPI001B39E606|nr:glutathione S-transferase family protein [Pseudoalteromonas sp. MMG012]MBQ4850388.1 glutathione S-transferase family protein [Pseudoalteromonas sp. MMG012]
MEDIKLYGHPLSGHTHKVSLFLSILQLEYEFEIVDLKAKQHQSDAFLKLNAFGQVPVLKHAERVICDSSAILVYLAKVFDNSGIWYPSSPVKQAMIHRLLAVSSGPLVMGPAMLRGIKQLNKPGDYEQAIVVTTQLYQGLERLLHSHDWLACSTPTIADIALYSYIKLAEGASDINGKFPSILNWQSKVESLPGFMAVP